MKHLSIRWVRLFKARNPASIAVQRERIKTEFGPKVQFPTDHALKPDHDYRRCGLVPGGKRMGALQSRSL
jgi:hypothetical protein